MNTSSTLIMKESLVFLWNHLRIILAIILFGFATVAIIALLLSLLGLGAIALFGQETLLLFFQHTAADILPALTPWLALVLGTASFFFIFFILLYPRVCIASYVLGLLRGERVTMARTLYVGFKQTIAAWRIVLGLILFPCMVMSIATTALLVWGAPIGVGLAAMGLCALAWFFVANCFIAQLVADGATDFMAATATSWNYVKRSCWQLFGLVITLWVINLIASHFLSAFIFSIIGCVVAAWYVIVINKIYLIARSESTYKYSSE